MHIINLRKAIGLTSIAITDIQAPEAEGGMDGRSVPPSVVTVPATNYRQGAACELLEMK